MTTLERDMQRRTELLLGKDKVLKLNTARILIFGWAVLVVFAQTYSRHFYLPSFRTIPTN